MMAVLCGIALAMWAGLLLVPWQPWRVREVLPAGAGPAAAAGEVTVLIPARNEAAQIGAVLRGVARQGAVHAVILIDDQSTDGTANAARAAGLAALRVIQGSTPPPGWTGKLWALHQGLAQVETGQLLLLDADIELDPGVLGALQGLLDEGRALVSVMASLHMGSCWEKLLLPPFIYFFRLIYPFALANDPRSRVAAAAGGCVLLRTAALRAAGGFEHLRGALIDDCTLAGLIKRGGGRTWLGLSRQVRAIRPYGTLAGIWNMVARTAFTQLRYSPALLLLCSALLLVAFVAPLAGLFAGGVTAALALAALAAMYVSFVPTVRYYELVPLWTLLLPVAACLYLAMTWTSALRYWRGERSRWKGRSYDRTEQRP